MIFSILAGIFFAFFFRRGVKNVDPEIRGWFCFEVLIEFLNFLCFSSIGPHVSVLDDLAKWQKSAPRTACGRRVGNIFKVEDVRTG